MDPLPHAPGDGSVDPLLAEGPLPPGSQVEELVDAMDDRIRKGGPEEVEAADEQADAVEDRAGENGPDSRADAAADPTDDGPEQDTPA